MSRRGRRESVPGGDAAVRTYHLSKSYLAGQYALHDLTLEVKKGEFVFLTGSSGAGKTTLLKTLFAAERPSEGQVLVLGRNVGRLSEPGIAALRRRVGVVFQDFKLLTRRTIDVALVGQREMYSIDCRMAAGACSRGVSQNPNRGKKSEAVSVSR